MEDIIMHQHVIINTNNSNNSNIVIKINNYKKRRELENYSQHQQKDTMIKSQSLLTKLNHTVIRRRRCCPCLFYDKRYVGLF